MLRTLLEFIRCCSETLSSQVYLNARSPFTTHLFLLHSPYIPPPLYLDHSVKLFETQSPAMAETQPRPSGTRGRGSTRGRGGYSSRGGGRSASKSANTASAQESFVDPLEEESELGQLKKKYNTQLNQLKELFPDWTLDDLVFALQETDGDVETTVERITDGMAHRTHWASIC